MLHSVMLHSTVLPVTNMLHSVMLHFTVLPVTNMLHSVMLHFTVLPVTNMLHSVMLHITVLLLQTCYILRCYTLPYSCYKHVTFCDVTLYSTPC